MTTGFEDDGDVMVMPEAPRDPEGEDLGYLYRWQGARFGTYRGYMAARFGPGGAPAALWCERLRARFPRASRELVRRAETLQLDGIQRTVNEPGRLNPPWAWRERKTCELAFLSAEFDRLMVDLPLIDDTAATELRETVCALALAVDWFTTLALGDKVAVLGVAVDALRMIEAGAGSPAVLLAVVDGMAAAVERGELYGLPPALGGVDDLPAVTAALRAGVEGEGVGR